LESNSLHFNVNGYEGDLNFILHKKRSRLHKRRELQKGKTRKKIKEHIRITKKLYPEFYNDVFRPVIQPGSSYHIADGKILGRKTFNKDNLSFAFAYSYKEDWTWINMF